MLLPRRGSRGHDATKVGVRCCHLAYYGILGLKISSSGHLQGRGRRKIGGCGRLVLGRLRLEIGIGRSGLALV
jgi:hypothetical protein